MKDLSKIIILVIVMFLSVSPRVLADTTVNCPTGTAAEVICYQCGDNCLAKLDTSGKMTISGSGEMKKSCRNLWLTKLGNITSLIVENGITNVGYDAFYGASKLSTVELADSVKTIDNGGLQATALSHVIIGENSQLTNIVGGGLHNLNSGRSIALSCKGDMDKCAAKKRLFDNYNNNYYGGKLPISLGYYEKYDEYDNPLEIWNSSGVTHYAYKYDAGGNLSRIYKNGIVTYRRRIYTPAEATAAVQKGSKNNFSLTFR